jgi:hypothetical protein
MEPPPLPVEVPPPPLPVEVGDPAAATAAVAVVVVGAVAVPTMARHHSHSLCIHLLHHNSNHHCRLHRGHRLSRNFAKTRTFAAAATVTSLVAALAAATVAFTISTATVVIVGFVARCVFCPATTAPSSLVFFWILLDGIFDPEECACKSTKIQQEFLNREAK